MRNFIANWGYLVCAQLAYNLSLCIWDLKLPEGLCIEKSTSRGYALYRHSLSKYQDVVHIKIGL